MGGRWDQSGIPHKGWMCVEMEDLEEPTHTCEMCGQEEIRYVHYMMHPQFANVLAVGCICACNMENDYWGPRKRERQWRNRASRKARWLTREWRISHQGNPYLKADGLHVVVFRHKKTLPTFPFGFCVSRREDVKRFSRKRYRTVEEAKLAAFDVFWELLNVASE
jgi:hypothetical protein